MKLASSGRRDRTLHGVSNEKEPTKMGVTAAFKAINAQVGVLFVLQDFLHKLQVIRR